MEIELNASYVNLNGLKELPMTTTSSKAGHLSSVACSKYLQIKLCPKVPWNVSARNVKNIEANIENNSRKRSFEEAKRSDQQSSVQRKATDIGDKYKQVIITCLL
jgi:hypothetical protein